MPFQLEPTDINSLIVQFIHDRAAMAADRGLKLDSQLAADLPPVMVDTQRFAQVMSNLTTNALYYTPVGGTVTLCTAARQDENLDWVAFTVRDTGHGIAEQELPRLFERFFRGEASRKSAAPGTGLGLSICKAIAESMGGHITVENQPGGGAAFTVWLKPFDCQSSTSDLLAK
jgi:two-component system sensor histidine kinase BaeS